MKKVYSIIISLIVIIGIIVLPSFAIDPAYGNTWIGWREGNFVASQYRSRIEGTFVADWVGAGPTSGVNTNDLYSSQIYMPSVWYDSQLTHTEFTMFPSVPELTTVSTYTISQSYSNELLFSFGDSSNRAPYLVFEGIMYFAGDGPSTISIRNTSEAEIYVYAAGRKYVINDSTSVIRDIEVGHHVLSGTNDFVSIDNIIRDYEVDGLDTDIYFFGNIFIGYEDTNSLIDNDYSFAYDLAISGFPRNLTYTDVEVTNNTGNTVYDQLANLLSPNAGTYPSYEGYTDINGDFIWYGVYNGGKITVNVPTYARDSVLEITENGRYNVGSYNYVEVTAGETVIETGSVFSWLLNATQTFLTTEILPNFSFGGLLLFMLGFALVLWMLKIFLGG